MLIQSLRFLIWLKYYYDKDHVRRFLLTTIRDLVLCNLVSLMQAMGQWSLIPRSKTPEATILSFLYDRIISVKEEFEMFFRLGLVGSVISSVRLRLSHLPPISRHTG